MPRTWESISCQTLDHRERVIAGVVIDDHPLPLLAQLRHRLRETRVQGLEVGGFVERRRENGDHQDPIDPSTRSGRRHGLLSDATTRCCSSSVIW